MDVVALDYSQFILDLCRIPSLCNQRVILCINSERYCMLSSTPSHSLNSVCIVLMSTRGDFSSGSFLYGLKHNYYYIFICSKSKISTFTCFRQGTSLNPSFSDLQAPALRLLEIHISHSFSFPQANPTTSQPFLAVAVA